MGESSRKNEGRRKNLFMTRICKRREEIGEQKILIERDHEVRWIYLITLKGNRSNTVLHNTHTYINKNLQKKLHIHTRTKALARTHTHTYAHISTHMLTHTHTHKHANKNTHTNDHSSSYRAGEKMKHESNIRLSVR